MTLKQIYNLAIKLGIKADLRGKQSVEKALRKNKEEFKKLPKDKQKEFDQEKFKNPYSDTRILIDLEKKQIKHVMVGIDIGVEEVVLAERLGNVDAIISHHPIGPALADLSDVMDLQIEVLNSYGIPINVAQGVMKPRISEVARGVSALNHYKTIDAAKLMNFDLMCVHTPCDNLAATHLKRAINRAKSETVGGVIKTLKKIPEYKEAVQRKAGPKIFSGEEGNYAGKIALTEITGGTEGAKEIYSKMEQAGVGTVIGMHMSEEHKKQAEKYHINVVIAGHIASDSLGINLFLDKLEKRGIKIIPCSGLIRIKRK